MSNICADRMRSIIIAIVIGLGMGFLGSKNLQFAFLLYLMLIIALLVDGFSGFCPLRVLLRKILPKCEDR